MTEGNRYVLKTGDFNNPDGKSFTFDDPDGDAWQAVIIDTLPANGTLQLDGVDVVAGQAISKADIDNGKLTYKAPSAAGDQALGDAALSFQFRVQDDSGTADDTSGQYTFALTIDQFIQGGNESNDGTGSNPPVLTGGAGNDVILGDDSQTATLTKGKNYNIAIVLDTSGSMNDEFGDPPVTRLDAAKAAIKQYIDNVLLPHAQGPDNVILSIITFGDNKSTKIFQTPLSVQEVGLDDITALNLLNALYTDAAWANLAGGGDTPYGKAFDEVSSWFFEADENHHNPTGSGSGVYKDYERLTLFITDGKPEGQTPQGNRVKELPACLRIDI